MHGLKIIDDVWGFDICIKLGFGSLLHDLIG